MATGTYQSARREYGTGRGGRRQKGEAVDLEIPKQRSGS